MDLDRALARQAKRLGREILDPPQIRTADDIKRLLIDLDPRRTNTDAGKEIQTTLAAPDSDGKMQTYVVRASTRSQTKREMIIAALLAIKSKAEIGAKAETLHQATEVNGSVMRPADVGKVGNAMSWIDPLINKWFAAERRGLLLCWSLADGYEYRYDIFAHRLERERTPDAAS